MEIKSLYPRQEEVNFWGLQITEHLLFISLGIVDVNLKTQAQLLKSQWENLLLNKLNDEDMRRLIKETYDYHMVIQKILKDGIWIGWLSLSFMNHIIEELLYFNEKFNGTNYNINEEMKFWVWHHQTEFGALEKLLDPTEEEISKIMKEYIEETKNLTLDLNILMKDPTADILMLNEETQKVINEYFNFTLDLEKDIENNIIISNISPDLIRHVIREGERAIDIFQKLNM